MLYTVDTSHGPWFKSGRFLIRRADVAGFKANRYDPYFRKGRWARDRSRAGPVGSVVSVPIMNVLSNSELVRVKQCLDDCGGRWWTSVRNLTLAD
jgi:hypothetical protein